MPLKTSMVFLLTASASAWANNYGKLPLSFEPNQGQTDARVQFLSRGRNQTLFLASTEAVMRNRNNVFRMKLTGSNPASKAEGADPQIARSNYFTGNDPSKWRMGVANYGRVRFADVYPGIDLVYYGKQGQLEYDWIVRPGADLSRIRLRFEGVQKMRVDADGDLVLETPSGEIREKKPVVYQSAEIPGRYLILGRHEVGFQVEAYDASKQLVIDPVVVYSSFLGGSTENLGNAIAADGAGNAYVTGYTNSTDFPTVNAAQSTGGGNAAGDDVFVSKVSADGSTLLYSTFVGGSNNDFGEGIAVDSAGDAFVTGWTQSKDFPVVNAYQSQYSSKILGYNSFVVKLNASGNKLLFSTYLGGDANDQANGIAVDASGNAYITGGTDSSNFPTTSHVIQGGPNTDGKGFAFVTKLSGNGALSYSTFLNSGDLDGIASVPQGIAVDPSGNAYVTGFTVRKDFPAVNALQSTYTGSQGIFVAKINPTGSAFVYCTYLDGSGKDQANAIAADSAGNAYVTGSTTSSDFPTKNAVQSKFGGVQDAFVTKINPTGSQIVYSTYLGGSSAELGFGIGVDAAGKAWVAGTTLSTDFPMVDPFSAKFYDTDADLFVSRFSADGSTLVFSSYAGDIFPYQGGTGRSGLAVDQAGNAYITGVAGFKFPIANAFQTSAGGLSTAFVLKIAGGPAVPSISAVVNGASFQPPIVSNSWATIQGSNLSAVTDNWDSFIVDGKLPTSVDGVSVTIGFAPAYIYYVSPGQINLIVPPDLPAGTVQVVVKNAAGSSAAFTATVSSFGPAFFPWPNNQVVATRQDFSLAAKAGTFAGTTTAPAKPGDVIILWGTGFGTTIPAVPPGIETPGSPTYNTSTLPTVTIDNVVAKVYGAALAPGLAALYQVAIQVPTSLGNGDWPIVASIGGVSSPSGTVLAVHQ